MIFKIASKNNEKKAGTQGASVARESNRRPAMDAAFEPTRMYLRRV